MKFKCVVGLGLAVIVIGVVSRGYFWIQSAEESVIAPVPTSTHMGRQVASTKIHDVVKAPLGEVRLSENENKKAKAKNKSGPQILNILSDASRNSAPWVQSGGESYVLLPTVRAVKSDEVASRDQKNVITTKFGYTFLKNTTAEGSLPRVVYNERTQQFALLTGVFKIGLRTPDLAYEIGRAYDLKTVAEFPHLKIAHLLSATDGGLQEKLGSLRRHPEVTEVELEVLENQAAHR